MALHEVQLKGYSVRPGNLSLGTYDSYGIEQLHVTLDDTWSGLAIDATFHNTPNDKGVTMLVDADGLVPVPPEACMRASKYATITFRGVQDGVQRISCNLPYVVLDHAQVPGANSTATPSENAQALAQMQDLRDGAVDAKNQAEAARDAAAKSATAAAASEKAAALSAVAAAGSAAQAEAQKTAAAKSASDAQGYMQTASGAATAANASAKNAEENAASAASAAKKAADESVAANIAVIEKMQADVASKQTAAAGDAKTARDAAAGAADAKAAAVAAQKDAAASKAAAAKSAADADDTANSIKDSMAQISENKEAVSKLKKDTAALQKRQNVLVGSETGNLVSCDDAFAAPLCGLNVYGKSMQDGTPTPDAPVPIVSAGDSGSVAVKVTGKNLFYEQEFQKYFIDLAANTVGLSTGNVSCVLQVVTGAKYYVTRSKIGAKFRVAVVDKLPTLGHPVTPSSGINADSKRQIGIYATSKYMVIQCEDEAAFSELMVSLDSSTAYSSYREQLLTLPTPNGLPGIPVTSGGNYTDQNGQQWICNEVDLERGVKVQRVITMVFSDSLGFIEESTKNGIRFVSRSEEFKKADKGTADSSAFCSALPLGREGSTWLTPNVFTITTKLYVRFENITSLGELQQYLQQTPMSLTAILATPIETPLTPDEIAAYKALTAYAPDTVVQASDGAGVKLEYQRDVNIAIKNLEDAIASMTAT